MATIHPPEEIAYRVHAIDEIAQHGVLLLEHLVLLHETGDLQSEGGLVLVLHGVFLERCATAVHKNGGHARDVR